MKKLLSLLLVLVFFNFIQAPLYAKGPNYGGTGTLGVAGTYAGVLLPKSGNIANGLGIFALNLPPTGLGNGDFVYFQQGQTFTGSITGLTNPARGTLTALVEGQFNVTQSSQAFLDPFFGNTTATNSSVIAVVSGDITATFGSGASFVSAQQGYTGVTLTGKANLQIALPPKATTTTNPLTGVATTNTATGAVLQASLQLTVDGFQQSSQYTQSTGIGALVTAGATNGSSGSASSGTSTTTGS